ncbi:hypothetical protein [Isoalcanivorax beigongshangi]|uniref:Uncharacterized protein n=1 Tax=Isoalcanivorax beigongshangi TaxID=3238810 RepID=A0ABV4AII3_9GAMM
MKQMATRRPRHEILILQAERDYTIASLENRKPIALGSQRTGMSLFERITFKLTKEVTLP